MSTSTICPYYRASSENKTDKTSWTSNILSLTGQEENLPSVVDVLVLLLLDVGKVPEVLEEVVVAAAAAVVVVVAGRTQVVAEILQ